MTVAVRFTILERFLKGEISPQDLSTIRCTIVDQLLVMYAIAVARPEQYFQPDNPTVLNVSIRKLYYFVYRVKANVSVSQISRMAGLHVSTSRGAAPVRVTLPDRALSLIELHKNDPNGGVAKYFNNPTPAAGVEAAQNLAAAAVEQLRHVYGPEVLAIIKATL